MVSDKTVTSIAVFGMLVIILGINNDGLFIAIFDVGSINEVPYVCENKKCYTYDTRYVLEHFDYATGNVQVAFTDKDGVMDSICKNNVIIKSDLNGIQRIVIQLLENAVKYGNGEEIRFAFEKK